MNDTQTQIERLIELAIVQRTELKQLVEQLPQLREHLNAEIERNLEEIEPQLRSELEEFCEKRATDANAKVGSALETKIVELSKNLELTTQARYNAIKEQERKVEELRQLAEKKIEGHVAALPEAVKEIVDAELARFPRAGEIDQLRKEFAEPKGLNPRGKWLPSETYNRLDLVTYNGDSFTSAIDGNRSRPSRNAAEWTLIAARGTGGGGPTSLSELTTVPSNGDLLIGSGTSWVTSNLTAGAGISITVGAGEITISATDGDITLDDGTAASPSLHFTNDPDTGIYRPAANTLGISVSGTQVAYFDENGLTIPSAGVVAGGSFHAANGNANNPSHSFTSDQDTGFFRHATNEIGIALGGTQYATLTSTTFSVTPALAVTGAGTIGGNLTVSGTTDASSAPTGAIYTAGGIAVGTNKKFMATGTGGYWGAPSAFTLETLLIRGAGFGYNPGIYAGVQIGGTAGRSLVFGVDISSISGGNFTGAANEWIVPNTLNIRQVTSGGTDFSGAILSFANGGAATFASGVTLAGNLTVSGTGTSSVAGKLLINTIIDDGLGRLQVAGSITATEASGTGLFGFFGGSSLVTGTLGAQSFILRTNNSAALTLDSSQNATFVGTIGGMTKGDRDSINDDSVASFAPLKDRGFLVINNPDYTQNALIAYFKSGSSYMLYTIVKSADVGIYSTTTLTGTTGTDGKLNIGYNSAGGVATIYIENRLGGSVNVQRWAFGGSD